MPLNPEKGCDIDAYRDRPMNVRHMFLAAEIREALARDVPRIEVSEVAATTSFDTVNISVTWAPTEMVLAAFVTTEVVYAG